MDKSVITVVGRDSAGIISKVSTLLYENNVNILDISQTIVSGIFNMMMITDTEGMKTSYPQFLEQLKMLSEELGVDIRCQKEEIFDMMHRI